MKKPTAADLQTPTARERLPHRPKPYRIPLGRGIGLAYYRPKHGPGSWQIIVATGDGGQRPETFAVADDAGAPPDALTFSQAMTKALTIARIKASHLVALPVTIEQAIAKYETDLQSRGGSLTNATQVAYHLTDHPALRSLLLSQVTPAQLNDWRLALVRAGMKPATQKRLFKSVHACFNLAASLDDRIAANAKAWRVGLKAPKDADRARNAVHSLEDVRALVAAAYAIDPRFGLLVHTHAELGARSDQIARIKIAHLDGDRVAVPNSGKGRNRSKDTSGVTWRALTSDLARRLQLAAGNRASHEPLLVQADGTEWNGGDRARRLFARAVEAANVKPIDEDAVTLICFRHSSIVRRIEAGMPLKIVADLHNTSTQKIESNYGRFIVADGIDRRTLVNVGPGLTVVA